MTKIDRSRCVRCNARRSDSIHKVGDPKMAAQGAHEFVELVTWTDRFRSNASAIALLLLAASIVAAIVFG